MLAAPKLTRGQYEYLSSTFKTLAEGIILGSSAAFFLPEAFQMEHQISATRYFANVSGSTIEEYVAVTRELSAGNLRSGGAGLTPAAAGPGRAHGAFRRHPRSRDARDPLRACVHRRAGGGSTAV